MAIDTFKIDIDTGRIDIDTGRIDIDTGRIGIDIFTIDIEKKYNTTAPYTSHMIRNDFPLFSAARPYSAGRKPDLRSFLTICGTGDPRFPDRGEPFLSFFFLFTGGNPFSPKGVSPVPPSPTEPPIEEETGTGTTDKETTTRARARRWR
jgi:hypothetical protein